MIPFFNVSFVVVLATQIYNALEAAGVHVYFIGLLIQIQMFLLGGVWFV